LPRKNLVGNLEGKIQVESCWVATPCPENWRRQVLWNVILPRYCIASQSRRPWLESSLPWWNLDYRWSVLITLKI